VQAQLPGTGGRLFGGASNSGAFCDDAADVNDDGRLNITDPVYLATFLCLPGRRPPPPYPECWVDPTEDGLDCGAGRCGPLPADFENSLEMRFVLIRAGTFLRGSPVSERSREADERQHTVHLTCDYYMSVTVVTQAEYLALMGTNPSWVNGGVHGVNFLRPVEATTWDGATEFCRRLSRQESLGYRLPPEAEWEYACRAGTTTRFWFGDVLECSDSLRCPPCEPIAEYEWWCGNEVPGGPTYPVGLKMANPWGLFDMHGNVTEWCYDWYAYYPTAREVTNPIGPEAGTDKVIRGNGHYSLATARSAERNRLVPWNTSDGLIGFRVVLPLPGCDYVPTTP
jgi:formylglycine-generating enzyme required for sulfatase activity